MLKLLKIPQNKGSHFIYGFFIYVITDYFIYNLYSFLIVSFIAIGKEICDRLLKKTIMNIWDAIWTIVPALILYLIN